MNKFICLICIILINCKYASTLLIDNFSDYDKKFEYDGYRQYNQAIYMNSRIYILPNYIGTLIDNISTSDYKKFHKNEIRNNLKSSYIVKRGTDIIGSKRTLKGNWSFIKYSDSKASIYCYKKGNKQKVIYPLGIRYEFSPLKLIYEFPPEKYLNINDISQFKFFFNFNKETNFEYNVSIKVESFEGEKLYRSSIPSNNHNEKFGIRLFDWNERSILNKINKITFTFELIHQEDNFFPFFGIDRIEAYPEQ